MDIEILMPKYTKNLITNPSFENAIQEWYYFPSSDGQLARFEAGLLVGNDGFDTLGGTSANLSVTKDAAIDGRYGFKLAGTGALFNAYGIFNGPTAEKQFSLGCLVDLSKYDIVGAGTIRAVDTDLVVLFYIQEDGAGGWEGSPSYYTDGGIVNAAAFAVPETFEVKIDVVCADNPGDNDGSVRVYIDGTLTTEILNIDNDTRSLNTVEFGLAQNITGSGYFSMDNCYWRSGVGEFEATNAESTLERARYGRTSGKVETIWSQNNEGIYTRINTTNINGPVVGSAYVRGEGRVRLRLYDGLTGAQYYSQTMQLHDRAWQRLSVNGVTVGSDDYRLYVETDGTAPQEVTFYVDAVQLEEGGILTTYCDGDQPGCRWDGVMHASTSEREDTSLEGGEYVPFKDDECDPDSYYTELSGFGMPPVTINRQQMALSPGSFLDSTRVDERVLMINSFFKDSYAQKRKGNEKKHIYELRQRIEDLVKPDISPNSPEFWLRVGQDDKWLYIKAVYEAGMEFDFDVRNKWTSASSIRFLCMQPYWVEDSQETALLDYGYELGDQLYYAMRVDGEWTVQFNGLNNTVYVLEFDENDALHIGGNFTQDDDGLDIRRIAYANNDYSALLQSAAGFLNGPVRAIAPHPNGKIYLGGSFTQDGNGNAYGYVAEYDPVTNSFDNLGGGVSAAPATALIYAIDIAPNGNVYFGGEFTTAAGAPAYFIAYWDGGAWHTVGNIYLELWGGSTGNIRAIVALADDDIYAAGTDTNNAVLFHWDGSNWSIAYTASDYGSATAHCAILSYSGAIIFGVRGDDATARLFRYNGETAEQLGTTITGSVLPIIETLDEDSKGNLYLGLSNVTQVGSLYPESSLIIWNGTSFVLPDIAYSPQFVGVTSPVKIRSTDDIYIGFYGGYADNVNVSSITYVNNVGTAQVFPIISIDGPGKIIWIENQTSKQRAYMNYTTQENELLEIDFRTGKKTVVSNYRGDVPDAILPNSEDILLAAGRHDAAKANKFAVLIVDSVNPTVQLRYTPTHWSIDALDML